MIIAIDPGVSTGFAVARDGALLGAERIKLARVDDYPPALAGVARAWAASDPLVRALVVIETPIIRIREGSKGDPNDIVRLAELAGAYAGIAIAIGLEVLRVTPAQWKGSVPKSVHHRRVAESLPAQWLARFREECDHNVRDAIALAWWAVRRDPSR